MGDSATGRPNAFVMDGYRRALDAALRPRVLKLLIMTTPSTTDGECLNAVRAANRTLEAAGLSWPDVLTPALPAPEPQRRQKRPHWREVTLFCIEEGRCTL